MQTIRAQIGTIIPPPTNITEINQTFINLENQISSIVKNTSNEIDISNLKLAFEFNIEHLLSLLTHTWMDSHAFISL